MKRRSRMSSAPRRRPAPTSNTNRSRTTSSPPSRSASTSAQRKPTTAPPPATTPARPTQLTPAGAPSAGGGGGLMANIATAAAGSFIGSSLARAAFGAFGSNGDHQPQLDEHGNVVDASGVPLDENELRDQNRCYDQSITFMRCLQQNGQENIAMCQFPYENMTNCQRLHYPQQFEEQNEKQESGFF